jgi:hypothetical protein
MYKSTIEYGEMLHFSLVFPSKIGSQVMCHQNTSKFLKMVTHRLRTNFYRSNLRSIAFFLNMHVKSTCRSYNDIFIFIFEKNGR